MDFLGTNYMMWIWKCKSGRMEDWKNGILGKTKKKIKETSEWLG